MYIPERSHKSYTSKWTLSGLFCASHTSIFWRQTLTQSSSARGESHARLSVSQASLQLLLDPDHRYPRKNNFESVLHDLPTVFHHVNICAVPSGERRIPSSEGLWWLPPDTRHRGTPSGHTAVAIASIRCAAVYWRDALPVYLVVK